MAVIPNFQRVLHFIPYVTAFLSTMTDSIKLTEFSHGAGCGCKISPAILDSILAGGGTGIADPYLPEICEGSGVAARVDYPAVPVLEPAREYLARGAIPGGTARNFASYGEKVAPLSEEQKHILCAPQTSGGLLIAVQSDACPEVEQVLENAGITPARIGELKPWSEGPRIEVLQ